MRVALILVLAAGLAGTASTFASERGSRQVDRKSSGHGLPESGNWPARQLDWRTLPVDLSFLNEREKPAGRRGFLRAVGGRLVFDDGTPGRFWGTNLTAAALFGTSHEAVREQARRISALGMNLVRFHHHDSGWVDPNVFGARDAADTSRLSEAMLERLDWWIKCLTDEGIYVWLDLHVGRRLKAGDRIEGFDEIRKGEPTAGLHGFSYVNASIRQAMMRFSEDYVSHLNVHTGRRYKDEPGIVATMVTNENDLTQHFGNALLPDKGVPAHSATFMKLADAFAVKWGLPRGRIWRTWEPGPSKLFLNDLERQVQASLVGHLRSLGVRTPIVTTSTWGSSPISSLPALTVGDMIDVHSYGASGELERDPLRAAGMVHWLAAARVLGKPLTVSEWNVERFPVPDRHAVPLFIAASGRMQGWDAVLQYAYAQVSLDVPGPPSNWHAYNDPSLLAAMPAAALLFRRGDVMESGSLYVFAPSPDQLFLQGISAGNSRALRTAAERGKLAIALPEARELPWLKKGEIPSSARIFSDPGMSFLDVNAVASSSDGGELRRNWRDGFFMIDTERSQAAMGRIGNRTIRLADAEMAVETESATVAVQSLDERPIRRSRRILVSLAARSSPAVGNRLPFTVEPVRGRLRVWAPPGLKLYKIPLSGGSGRPTGVPYAEGRYDIVLDKGMSASWLLLK